MYSIIPQSKPIPLTDVQTLILQIKNQVCAGFPSPAEDLGAERIDLSKVLIKHPQATYLLKASGHSMVEAGIFDNDILVVNKAVKPRHGHIVVAVVDGERDQGKLMSTLDGLNRRYGKGSVLMASAGLGGAGSTWSMKQERRTPGYTTQWEDMPVARA